MRRISITNNHILRQLDGIRYVVPLREGGSLPAVIDTTAEGAFVVKFTGAGQGPKALIAEAVAAGIAQALDLPVPQPAVITLADGFGRSEPDAEIQDILRGSIGENFGLAFLSGATAFDPAIESDIDPNLAAEIVWFDAFITNVDRTVRNTNMLMWDGRLWLIDHGASLYFQHQWNGWEERAQSRFPQIKDHVLLHIASDLREVDQRLAKRLSNEVFMKILDAIPDAWMAGEDYFVGPDEQRAAFVAYLEQRLNGSRPWLEEALAAKSLGEQHFQERVTRRVE